MVIEEGEGDDENNGGEDGDKVDDSNLESGDMGGHDGDAAVPGDDLRKDQEDPSLESVREMVTADDDKCESNVRFVKRDGFIYRVWRPRGTTVGNWQTCQQLVLPKKYRATVLQLAHDIPVGGHLGIKKTKDRILQRYFWLGVFSNVKRYCQRCEICQRTGIRRVPKVGLV